MLVFEYHEYVKNFRDNGFISAAIGNFDGFHQGHQLIINKAVKYALKENIQSAVLTFKRHPQIILNKNHDLKLILAPFEKINKMAELGIDLCIFFPETIDFLSMKPEDFIKTCIIDALKTKKLFAGENFHFGKKAQGTPAILRDTLHKEQVACDISSLIKDENKTISSSRIRALIDKQQFAKVNQLLAYTLFHKALVIKGDQIGRTINIPTANLQYEISGFKEGIYKADVWLKNKHYTGMLFYGSRPTLYKEEKRLELHLLDYQGNEFYDEFIYFKPCYFLRENIKFPTLIDLRLQILKDIEAVRNKK